MKPAFDVVQNHTINMTGHHVHNQMISHVHELATFRRHFKDITFSLIENQQTHRHKRAVCVRGIKIER